MARHLVPDPMPAPQSGPRQPLPAELTSTDPASFAWGVLHERHPALIGQVRHAHPYQPAQHQALDRLLEEITSGTLRMLPPGVHDFDAWRRWSAPYVGRRWEEVPFLWAESYFYRRLLEAVGFFSAGPWYWIDPFADLKAAELREPTLEDSLRELDTVLELPDRERGQAVLLAALWGNRADLGFALTAGGDVAGCTLDTDLVADDSARLWSVLQARAGTVCVVADNAGRELLADLVLIDYLLTTGLASQVALHVKPTPYYVSDATASDVIACAQRLAATPGASADTAARLRAAFRDGRVRIETHWFSCAPLSFHHAPAQLLSEFASASLTIMKGDLNYRRLVGDRAWEPIMAFADTVTYLPGAIATLRTLKSEVVVGIAPDTLARLDAGDSAWRTTGTHALVQARPAEPAAHGHHCPPPSTPTGDRR